MLDVPQVLLLQTLVLASKFPAWLKCLILVLKLYNEFYYAFTL